MPKIPSHAKKVFSGIVFDVYHFEQKLYDGSTATFERLYRPYTLQCIPIVGNKILITKDEQPDREAQYTFPGGRHDEGESYDAGALREMQEETGYTSDDLELFSVYTPANKIDWDIYTYIAHGATKVSEPTLDAGERVTPYLVTFEEFVELICSPEFMEKEFAMDVMRMRHEGRLDELKHRLFKQNTSVS